LWDAGLVGAQGLAPQALAHRQLALQVPQWGGRRGAMNRAIRSVLHHINLLYTLMVPGLAFNEGASFHMVLHHLSTMLHGRFALSLGRIVFSQSL
jgi:hypothetical protein